MGNLEEELLERPIFETEVKVINDGVWVKTPSVAHFGEMFRKLKTGDYIIKISRWRNRGTAKQRRRYFAILGVIAKYTGDDKDYLHEVMKRKFLSKTVKIKLTGQDEIVTGSTRELTTDEYNLLTDSVIALAYDTMGLIVDVNDILYERE